MSRYFNRRKRRRSAGGARSGLWYRMCEIIDELRPRIAIMENVGELTRRGLKEVLGSLAEIRYDCEWQIISASEVGAWHKRERIWIITYPTGLRIQRLWSERFKITHSLDQTLLSIRNSNGKWKIEPDVYRIPDGIPDRVHRLKGLGNSIVPQIAELLFIQIQGSGVLDNKMDYAQ